MITQEWLTTRYFMRRAQCTRMALLDSMTDLAGFLPIPCGSFLNASVERGVYTARKCTTRSSLKSQCNRDLHFQSAETDGTENKTQLPSNIQYLL
jgi:hypothetical protein